jgi:hypothetical protein
VRLSRGGHGRVSVTGRSGGVPPPFCGRPCPSTKNSLRDSPNSRPNSSQTNVGNCLKPLRQLHKAGFDSPDRWTDRKSSLQNSREFCREDFANRPATDVSHAILYNCRNGLQQIPCARLRSALGGSGSQIERQGMFCRRQRICQTSQGFPSHARRMGKGGRGVAILPRRISAVPTATSHDPRVAVGTAERTLRSNWTPRPPLPTRRAVIVADDRPPAARSFRTGSRSYGFRSDRRRTGPACSSGATRRGRPCRRSSVRRSP